MRDAVFTLKTGLGILLEIFDIMILSFSISVKNEKPPDHCSVRWLPVYLKTALMPS